MSHPSCHSERKRGNPAEGAYQFSLRHCEEQRMLRRGNLGVSRTWNPPLAKFISPNVARKQAEPNYITPRRVVVSIHLQSSLQARSALPPSKRYSETAAGVFIPLIMIACIGCAVSKSNKSSVAEAMRTGACCRCHSDDFCSQRFYDIYNAFMIWHISKLT